MENCTTAEKGISNSNKYDKQHCIVPVVAHSTLISKFLTSKWRDIIILIDIQGEPLLQSVENNGIKKLLSIEKENVYASQVKSATKVIECTNKNIEEGEFNEAQMIPIIWGTIEWQRNSRKDGGNMQHVFERTPFLHTGYQTIEGKVEETKCGYIAVLRLVPKNREEKFLDSKTEEDLKTFKSNYDTLYNEIETEGIWEVYALVKKQLVFKDNPVINSSKLLQEEFINKCAERQKAKQCEDVLFSDEKQISDKTIENSWNVSASELNTSLETWQLVPSTHLSQLQATWRLLLVNKEICKCLKAGERLLFKSASLQCNNSCSVTLCSEEKTYIVERNELDSKIIIGFKFDRSDAWDSVSNTTKQMDSEQQEKSTNKVVDNYDSDNSAIEQRSSDGKLGQNMANNTKENCFSNENLKRILGIPILSICNSMMKLIPLRGITSQIHDILCNRNGVSTNFLFSSVQASPLEIAKFLCHMEENTFCDCIYVNKKWIFINPKFWFTAMDHIFKIISAFGLDFPITCSLSKFPFIDLNVSDKNVLSIGLITQKLREGEEQGYQMPMEILLQPSVIFQILQHFCEFSPNILSQFIETKNLEKFAYKNENDNLNTLKGNELTKNANDSGNFCSTSKFLSYLEFIENNQEAICDIAVFFCPTKIHRLIARHVLLCSASEDNEYGEGMNYSFISSTLTSSRCSIYLDDFIKNVDELLKDSVPWSITKTWDELKKRNTIKDNGTKENKKLYSEMLKRFTKGFPDLRSSVSHCKSYKNVFLKFLSSFKFVVSCDLSVLLGNCFFTPLDGKLNYMPHNLLPITVRERLMFLFEAKPVWSLEELEAYINPILSKKENLIQVIAGPPLRHCRTKIYNINRKNFNKVSRYETIDHTNASLTDSSHEILYEIDNDEEEEICVFFRWNLPLKHWDL